MKKTANEIRNHIVEGFKCQVKDFVFYPKDNREIQKKFEYGSDIIRSVSEKYQFDRYVKDGLER